MKNDLMSTLSKKTENRSATAVSHLTEMFGVPIETQITTLLISNLCEKDNHPFKVTKDDKLIALAESIKENGLMEPIIVRPIKNETYEILAGHRRTAAMTLNNETEIKAIIIEADDELANRIMISTNFGQRESYLPSEIAKSYFIRYNDLKNNRRNSNENSTGWNSEKIDKIMEKEFCTSKSKVYQYLRLNHLIAEMLDAVDRKQVNLKVAAEISHLRESEQRIIYNIVYIEKRHKLDLKKASKIKRESGQHELDEGDITILLLDKEEASSTSISFSTVELKKYQSKFKSYQAMKQAILDFLENY